jgi:hypothetical protein
LRPIRLTQSQYFRRPGHPPNTIAYTNMSLGQPGVPLDAEHADNFEDIEKQFAVKGARIHIPERGTY